MHAKTCEVLKFTACMLISVDKVVYGAEKSAVPDCITLAIARVNHNKQKQKQTFDDLSESICTERGSIWSITKS